MRPTWCQPLLFVLVVVCGLNLHRAAAQTPVACDLGVVLLNEADAPGYRLAGETKTANNGGIAAAMTRTFMGGDTHAVVSATILVLTTTVDGNVSSPSGAGRVLLQGFVTGTNADAGSFHTTGQLGIGEDDLSAAWTVQGQGVTIGAYADVFSRGPLLVIVAYLAPSGTADTSQLASFAQSQDNKLMSADLGQVAGACSQNSGG